MSQLLQSIKQLTQMGFMQNQIINAQNNVKDPNDLNEIIEYIESSDFKYDHRTYENNDVNDDDKWDDPIFKPVPKLSQIDKSKPNRIVMVIGETGSGKSSFLNSIVNYLWNVKYKDPFRYKLVHISNEKTESDTTKISSYNLAPSTLPYQLTLIDTPGFNDTRGKDKDEKTIQQIKERFTNMQQIDAIVFIIKSSANRLTPTQLYIFDRVFGIFAKDIKDNIFIVCTHHLSEEEPAALRSIRKENLSFSASFCLDNIVFNTACKPESRRNPIDWEDGSKQMSQLFSKLNQVQTKSLCSTIKVMKIKHELEYVVEFHLKPQITETLNKMLLFQTQLNAAMINVNDIDDNNVFVIKVPKTKVRTVDHHSGKTWFNCNLCKVTCNKPNSTVKRCVWLNETLEDFLLKCNIIIFHNVEFERINTMLNSIGCRCNCKNRQNHLLQSFRYENYTEWEEIKSTELDEKYVENENTQKIKSEQILVKLRDELYEKSKEVYELLDITDKCQQKLQNDALYHQNNCIHQMIKEEKSYEKKTLLQKLLSREFLQLLPSVHNTYHTDESKETIYVYSPEINDQQQSKEFSDMDCYTKSLVKFMKFVLGQNPKLSSNVVGKPKMRIRTQRTLKLNICEIWLAQKDEDTSSNFRYIATVLATKYLFSKNLQFKETQRNWGDMQRALHCRNKYFSILPLSKYSNLCDNKLMSHLAFASICCHYTRKVDETIMNKWPFISGNAVYVSDFTALAKFPVRDGFQQYGAVAFFDYNCAIIGIYCNNINKYCNNIDKEWEYAKWVWKTTFFTHVTIIDHLYETHLLKSNLLVNATINCLPKKHPLRWFLKQFTYGSVAVNQTAKKALFNKNGIIHRLWAFDYETIKKIFKFAEENYQFHILPHYVHESMRNANDSIFGFNQDADEFWYVMKTYVKEFIRIQYGGKSCLKDEYVRDFALQIISGLRVGVIDDEMFLDVLTELLTSVTGFHQHVGYVSDIILHPKSIGCRIRSHHTECSVEEYIQLLSLTALTAAEAPKLINDWSHLIKKEIYKEHYEEIKNVHNEWQKKLLVLSNKINDRNKQRNYPIHSMDPRKMDCSVSI
eukprot:384963_1